MLKRILFLSAVTLAIGFLVSATIDKSSSGAPASHTGAPNEQTCTSTGCHDDHILNSGTAKMSLNLGENISTIKPGETYTLKIQIKDKDVKRFGFQLLALLNKTNENVGKFKITDAQRTQILKNRKTLLDREYVTYTFNGTDAVNTGLGEWSVDWTAPENLTEKVTFYLAGVSGNDDMTDKGDYSYTTSLSLKTKKH